MPYKTRRRLTIPAKRLGGAFNKLQIALKLQNSHNDFLVIAASSDARPEFLQFTDMLFNMQRKIRTTCKKYLDLSLTPKDQKELLKKVKNKVSILIVVDLEILNRTEF